MNLKKILLILPALITLAIGPALAQDLTPDQIETALKNNKRLTTWDLPPFETRTQKQSFCQLATRQAQKSHDYTAYYNAAVIYGTAYIESAEYGFRLPHLTEKDMYRAREYANLAISKNSKKPEPDMYVLRGLVIERYLNIDEKLDSTTPKKDSFTPYAKKHADKIRLIIQDYEKALELNPDLPLWGSLYWYYQALGDADNTQRCYKKMEEQNRKILERNHIRKTVTNRFKFRQ